MPIAPTVEELLDDRLVRGQQHLAGPEHDQLAQEQHADVVRDGARRADVVRDDQERGVGLRVQVDDELVGVGHAHRIQPRVGLVEQDDLGVEHQRPGEARPLAHTAGDLARQLLLGAFEADHRHLFHDDVADLAFGLAGVLTQRERDVVEQVHRAE
jgi:hypothetical protein